MKHRCVYCGSTALIVALEYAKDVDIDKIDLNMEENDQFFVTELRKASVDHIRCRDCTKVALWTDLKRSMVRPKQVQIVQANELLGEQDWIDLMAYGAFKNVSFGDAVDTLISQEQFFQILETASFDLRKYERIKKVCSDFDSNTFIGFGS